MGILGRIILGPGYDSGYEAGEEYCKQGGTKADDSTINGVYEDEGSESADRFYDGWRDAEDNNRGFWSWLTNKQ